MDDPSYKTYLKDINVMIFDVDGVLTNGSVTITSDGELLRTMNIKDGYALKVAIDSGLRICIISGGSNEGVKTRLHMLGVSDIFMGVH
ncbi:MAG: 3-deoxy-D-manno-octulosonate 8-phosphate phosphatase, partial [Winogradskyella sp.]|nr:3-deoxy-D-manno-octulosonate 8-phosphate phosphatase [Winogradskyella sp.]